METEIVTRTNLTCPNCGFVEELDIPLDQWLIFNICASCGTRLRPLSGDCCVFCSYGEHHCVSKQRETLEKGIDKAWWYGLPCADALASGKSCRLSRWCNSPAFSRFEANQSEFMSQYDLAIIGAGQGGLPTTALGARLGAKVALIEMREVGGTWVNEGCIPTKTLLRSAEVMHLVRNRAYEVDVRGVDPAALSRLACRRCPQGEDRAGYCWWHLRLGKS